MQTEGNGKMTRHISVSWTLGAFCLFLACSSGQSARKAEATDSSQSMWQNVRTRSGGLEQVKELDTNHDGKPDVWEYRAKAKGADGKEYDRLLRKELDLNFDGKVDMTRYYGEDGEVEKEALDLDFDGKVDQWNYYQKGAIVRKERDTWGQGKPDEWVYYEKGHIVRKERDMKRSGRVDYWEYWENDQIDRIGEDLKGTGKADHWIKAPSR